MSRPGTSFLKHAVIYGAGTVLLQGASIILLPLYTRYLAPADYGVLEILNRVGDVLTVLLLANGLSGAAFSFFCQAKTTAEKARIAGTLYALVWSGLAAGVSLVLIGSDLLNNSLDIGNRWLAVLGISASLVQLLLMIPLTLMQARVESVAFVIASLGILCFRLALIVVAVVCCGMGIWGVLGGTLVATLISAAVLAVREFRRYGFHVDLAMLPAILRFAWPFLPGGLCGFILSGGDRLFLLPIAGREQVGLYSLGYRLASCVELAAFAPLFKVWSAEVYKAYRRPDASTAVGRMFTRLLAPYIFVGLGLCLFHRDIISVLATSAYQDAATVIPPLVLASFFLCTQLLLDSAFYVFRCTHYKLGITILATATIVGLYCVLIPPFGALGAAFSAMGAFFVYAAVTWVVSQRVFYVRYEKMRLLAMLLLAGSLAAPTWWLNSGFLSVAGKLVLLAAWPISMWSLGLVTREEKRLLVDLAIGLFRALQAGLRPSRVLGKEVES